MNNETQHMLNDVIFSDVTNILDVQSLLLEEIQFLRDYLIGPDSESDKSE